MTETEHRITEIVRDAVRGSSENRLRGLDDEPAWGDALVGFAAGDDPLFEFLKEDIGEFYWTPKEIFGLTFGTGPAASVGREAPRLSVVAWVLPQTGATKADQRQESRFPADRWVISRAYWQELSDDVHATVVARLAAMGLRAVAPEQSAHWRTAESPLYGRASTWSQRHTAFVAGLGTFGLSDGLITPVGKAMRAGSVVVEAALAPSPRRYEGHHDWCLFYVDGTCEDCIRRCPAGAITKAGHDKVKCEAYLRRIAVRTEPLIGSRTGGCGLCQAGVRCESGIPAPVRPRVG
jgi:epoxyqueuosine reductase